MRIRSQEKGKQAEFWVFGELIRRGVSLYVPVVDVEGIDAIARRKDGACLEIQVRSVWEPKYSRWFYASNLVPRPSFFIIGVDMTTTQPEVWIIPSVEFSKYATVSRLKTGGTSYDLRLNSGSRKFGKKLSDILNIYRDAWHLLTG